MNRRAFLGTAPAVAFPLFRTMAGGKTIPNTQSPSLVDEVLKTDMRISNAARMEAGENIQKAADACSARDFAEYVRADAQTAGKMREKFAILRYFDDAFSKTAEWIKNGKPRRGEVQLGLVYNMGYVVKTPTLTFAIDLCPRGGNRGQSGLSAHYAQPSRPPLAAAHKHIKEGRQADSAKLHGHPALFRRQQALQIRRRDNPYQMLRPQQAPRKVRLDIRNRLRQISRERAHFPHGRRLRYKTGRSGARTGRIHSAPRSGIGHSKVRNTNHKTENHIDVAYTRTRA